MDFLGGVLKSGVARWSCGWCGGVEVRGESEKWCCVCRRESRGSFVLVRSGSVLNVNKNNRRCKQ